MPSHHDETQLKPAEVSFVGLFSDKLSSDETITFSSFSDLLSRGLKNPNREIRNVAWGIVVTKHHDRLVKDILASTRKRDLVDDLANDVEQETWMTSLRKIHLFDSDDEEQFYRWLRVIAVNHVRNFAKGIRSEANIRSLDEASGDEKFDHHLYREGVYLQGTENSTVLSQKTAALVEALSTLSERDQEILMRCLVNGEKPAQLAREFGIEARSVSTALDRAKKRIRKVLEINGYNERY